MPFGYNGKILRVDLSCGRIRVEEPDDIFYRRYVGGEGLVAYYLLKELEPGVDPLSPKNKLIFAAGPITGVPVPGSGRNSVGGKSPLTGGFGESEVGGMWSAELKHAGFDAVIIDGKSKDPVYLWVHDEEAEIMDARHIWGKETGDTESLIRKELRDPLVRVASIGPAGEKMVRFACIMNDLKDAAGRTGLGAVMGSKGLKAIAVRGRKKLLDVYDRQKLKDLAGWLIKNLNEVAGWAHNYGTGVGMDSGVASGNLPTRNFRDGNFHNPQALDARTIKETISIGMDGCYACPIRCKKVVKFDEPWQVDPKYGGPEYEALAALGSNCGIDDLKAVTKANEICNRYSMDSISTGCAIAFAMECYENGILTEKDTDGLDLRFGNAEAMLRMVKMIGDREGFGDLLAEGVKRAAEIIGKGSEKFAIHVKGLEVPMHEPRLKRALAVGYAVSPTGADHMHNLHDTVLADGRALKNFSALGILEPIPLEDLGPKKVSALINFVNWRVLDNCLLLCDFVPWDFHQKTEIVRATTGWNTTAWELMKVGERVTTMARIFNLREGFTCKDDWLPERFFSPTTSGPLSNTALDREKLRRAISIYYEMMGWDENGVPKEYKLEELGIEWLENYCSQFRSNI
ncbi:MAG: aldehyde ferredoxin oxidoreductase family protein [Nitrososphaerota archaeon]|nr:aldehyde ferredoxin oxidoreductase family protein [Candidatus Bathyarchaeota archaeon]MDW8048604.1 aldehyde ferredoxin oxidoreductase family protein [Nitrososphaerota archaeon]